MKIFDILKKTFKKEKEKPNKKNIQTTDNKIVYNYNDNLEETIEDKNSIKIDETEIFTIIDKSKIDNFNDQIKELKDFDKKLKIGHEEESISNLENDYESYIEKISQNIIEDKEKSILNKPEINKLVSDKKINNEDVVVMTLDDLTDYYKKRSKEKYLIVENNYENNVGEYEETERNKYLNQFSENIAKNIFKDEDQNIIENDSIDIIEENENIEDLENETSYLEENEEINPEYLNNIENLDGEFSNDKIFNDEYKEDSNKEKNLPENLKELKNIFEYLNELLEKLPKEKVKKFVNSNYFKLYKKLMYELNTKKS
ncbi:MAG: hypothetical protein N3A58_00140 [Spirochaetes bacterium]|nr:hypothetical protein [Spirochaetota bacterium]